MKLFLDTADVSVIEQYAKTGLLQGVTTNPTHLSKQGGNPREVIAAIGALFPAGHVSVEITEKEPEAVYKQALALASVHSSIVVKIPCHEHYYEIINKLVQEGIKINVTLIFTLLQAVFMSKLGVTYVSPFVGRLDDIGVEGMTIVAESVAAKKQYGFKTEILAASLRSVSHLHQAVVAGADALTVPAAVLQKALHHPLTDAGIALFDRDWQSVAPTKFP